MARVTSVPLRGRVLLLAILLAGVLGSTLAQEATPVPDPVPVLPPDALLSGASLDAWSARHWQWTLSFPVIVNPGHDVTGARCGYGQAGPAFFLPRNFPPCQVPAGVALVVPIAGGLCTTAERPAARDASALRACAAAEAERYSRIVVRVDGQAIPDIAAYRATTSPFTVLLPENNVLGAPPGPATAVADGYQVILPALPVGDHEIMVHLELADGTVLPDKVARITVVAPPTGDREATPDPGTPGATPVR